MESHIALITVGYVLSVMKKVLISFTHLPSPILDHEMHQSRAYFTFEKDTKTEISNTFWVNEALESCLIFTFIWK